MRNKYDSLKEQYPEYVSLDQLYRILKIAKRSAVYLLEHGFIPYIDTGRKTWKYKIAVTDIITYMRRREQWGSMIPRGAVTSRKTKVPNPRVSFSSHFEKGEEHLIRAYFQHIYEDYPDVLRIRDVVEMTGLSERSIRGFIRSGIISHIRDGNNYLIPKPYLMDFVASMQYLESKSSSAHFKRILKGFELWRSSQANHDNG